MKSFPLLAMFLFGAGIISMHPRPQFIPKSPVSVGQTYCLGSTPCVVTYHNHNTRDGVNPNETVLGASTLATISPTPRWTATADGQIYTQPLYLHQLLMNGTAQNVVYAATENNTVYAWDADSTSSLGTVLNSANLNNASDLGSGYTEIAVPYTDLPSCGSPNIQPEVGVTGTPVIDLSVTPPVLYVVSKHEDIDQNGGKTYRQKLHALAVDTLQELPGSPVILDTSFASQHASGFDPLLDLQRAALALFNTGDPRAPISPASAASGWVGRLRPSIQTEMCISRWATAAIATREKEVTATVWSGFPTKASRIFILRPITTRSIAGTSPWPARIRILPSARVPACSIAPGSTASSR